MLAGPRLSVTVATTHVPLAEMPRLLTVDGIASTIWLTAEGLAGRFGITAPRVAVAGLNPHAGEAGRFGDEGDLMKRAIGKARARQRPISRPRSTGGPRLGVPPGHRRGRRRSGRALPRLGPHPAQLLKFDDGVNLTLGPPFVRASPDRGTAYDIADAGRARAQSCLAALNLARATAH